METRSVRFLFILSTERSGSTLLSLMLGGHRRLVAPPELHLMAYPTVDQWLERYPEAIKSLEYLLDACGLGMDRKEIEERFAGWSPEALYKWVMAQPFTEPVIIVDKTPKYAREWTALNRTAILEPLYIWLLRHPLGVAASQIALRRKQREDRNQNLLSSLKYPFFRVRAAFRKSDDIYHEVAYWTWVNSLIEQFLVAIPAERKRKVHFEHLVKDPRSVMEQLCQWLGISFEPAMLQPQDHIPRALDWRLGDPKACKHGGIDPTVADSWQQYYSERTLDDLTGRLLGVPTREAMARWGIS